MNNYYIAVDFDGTLCKGKFPDIGKPRKRVIKKLIKRYYKLRKIGYEPILILWTCREDLPERDYLTEAVLWCKQQGIEFDYINENPKFDMGYPDKVRKIYANEYWDDKSVKV